MGPVVFLVVWGVVVVLVLNPILRGAVGPWFAWWLVIMPSIEFDRSLKEHEFGRGARAGGTPE
jgi:hypothetical protein